MPIDLASFITGLRLFFIESCLSAALPSLLYKHPLSQFGDFLTHLRLIIKVRGPMVRVSLYGKEDVGQGALSIGGAVMRPACGQDFRRDSP